MKIIGQDEREENFIVTMTKWELARLQNQSYTGNAILRVGNTVDINKAWDDLNAFQAAAHNIASAATTLRAVADLAEVAKANYIINPEPAPKPEDAK